MSILAPAATHAAAWARLRCAFAFTAATALASAALLAGCTTAGPRDSAAQAETAPAPTFLLVRHAEKGTDNPRDPSLTPEGDARAHRLAAELRDAPLVAVYSTDTKRTRATATPAANAHGLAVSVYDPGAADAFARELRARHTHGLVLVVGHSNTVPALAAALCACEVPPMAEHEYGRRYRLRAGPGIEPAALEAEAW